MARFDAFIGGSYQSQAVTADCERSINWFPEVLQSPGASAKTVLYPTPGVELVGEAATGNGRAHFAMAGREFAVIGPALIEIYADGHTVNRGALALGDFPATISSNGDLASQLFITSGEYGYIFALDTNTLTQIAALSGKATMGDYLDGYFLALDAKNSTLYYSALGDGLTWTPGADYEQRSLAPDPWRAMKVVGRYIWLFGEQTTEIWQDVGNETHPFAPFPSALLTYGVRAAFSVCVLGSAVIWLANTKSGRISIIRASGQDPEIISTYPLESAMQGYTDLASAVADAYSYRGHSFYLLSFDRENITWAWDSETKLWHERGTWVPQLSRYSSWRPRFYAFAFDDHRMLDMASGKIYRMGDDIVTDVDGVAIRRVRRAPGILEENKRIYYSSLEVDFEPGLKTLTQTTTVPAEFVLYFQWVQEAESNIVTFTAIPVAGTFVVYNWDFGDGNTAEGSPADNYYPGSNNTYTITLTCLGTDGNWYTLSTSMTTNYGIGQTGSVTGDDTPTTVTTELGAPHVMLRLSNDGGKTWWNEMMRSAGKLGEYLHRVRWNRLGCARRRVFEISVSDAAPWRIIGAYLEAKPTERP